MEEHPYQLPAPLKEAYERLPAPLSIFLLEACQRRLLLVSDGMTTLLGWSRAELMKRYAGDPAALVHPQDLPVLRDAGTRFTLDPEKGYKGVSRLLHADGSYSWISARGVSHSPRPGVVVLYLHYADVSTEQELQLTQAALQQQREGLMQVILESTQTAIFWKDTDRRFVGANRAFLDFYGFADETAILGKNDEEMGWHDDPDPYRSDELQVLRRGVSTHRVPGRCLARGVMRDIVASKAPLYAGGAVVGLVGSFEDVTTENAQRQEIDRLNSQLRDKVSEYDMLMAATNVSIMKIKLDEDYTIEWCNDIVYRASGYTPEEHQRLFRGKARLYYQYHQEEYSGLVETMRRALQQGSPSFEVATRLPTKNGSLWVKGVGTFSGRDPATGRPTSIYAVYTDVTEVVRTQEQLHEAELKAELAQRLSEENQRLQQIIDCVPSGIGVCRLRPGESTVMTVNRYFSERYGITNEMLTQHGDQRMLAFLHPEDAARSCSDREELFAGGDIQGADYRLRGKDGRYSWVHVTGRRVQDPGGEYNVYFGYADIDGMKQAEAALRSSRQLYQEAVSASGLIVWQYDAASRRITMMMDSGSTRDLCQRLGIPAVVENGPEALSAIIDPQDRVAFQEMYRQIDRGAARAECEFGFRMADPPEQHYERITCVRAVDESGAGTVVYCIGQDVTRQRVEEEKYTRAFRQLTETPPYSLGSFRLNLTTDWCGDGRSAHPFALKLQESHRADGAMQAFARLIADPDIRARFQERFNRRALLQLFDQGQTRVTMEVPILYPDGRRHWRQAQLFMLQNPGTGDVEAITYAIDIDDTVKNEQIARFITSENFDYIGLIDPTAHLFEFRHRRPGVDYGQVGQKMNYEECRAYVASNFVEKDELAHFEECTRLDTILTGLRRGGGRWQTTYQRTAEGCVTRMHLQYSWLDQPEGEILVIRSDLSAAYVQEQQRLRQMQEALLAADRANEAKSTFLSSMSHDLRTPLNGVLGFTDLALREQDPAKKQDYLGKVRTSGQLLANLVNDTLELSRIESGKMVLQTAPVRGRDLWQAVLTSVEPAAREKGVHLAADTSRYPNEAVMVDQVKMQKIFLNLLSNAVKYTPAGGTVSFDVQAIDPPVQGRTRRIVVEDTGIGMSSGFLPRMFEPFAQEHRPESAGVSGTGLGLSIVKRIVDLMGGTIEVQSAVGAGTRVTVELPVATAGAAVPRTSGRAPAVRLAGRRVLLCEDNYLNTEIAVLLLKDKGIAADCAQNGRQGVDLFRAAPAGTYDAVLMDIRMPEMDGYQAARAIRALDRLDARVVPIIAMTADAFEEDMRRAREAGMNGFVSKPIEPNRLFSELEQQLGRRPAGR